MTKVKLHPNSVGDQISRTAKGVFIDWSSTYSVVHRLTSNRKVPGLGRQYRTACGRDLCADSRAVLTTRPPTCPDCRGAR